MDIKYSVWKKRTAMLKELLSYIKESSKVLSNNDDGIVKGWKLNLLASKLYRRIQVIISQPKRSHFESGTYKLPKENNMYRGDHVIPLDQNIKRDDNGNVEIVIDGVGIDGKKLFEINESFRCGRRPNNDV